MACGAVDDVPGGFRVVELVGVDDVVVDWRVPVVDVGVSAEVKVDTVFVAWMKLVLSTVQTARLMYHLQERLEDSATIGADTTGAVVERSMSQDHDPGGLTSVHGS